MLFSSYSDTAKRSNKLSKLELWLNDNSVTHELSGSNTKTQNDKGAIDDQSNIIFTLLEDSLSPLKCSINSNCIQR